MDEVETCVIGAGVVGLAIARELAMAGQDVILLEAEQQIGQGISSRNSEVIHAGIYYPAGSLKAAHCVRGKQLLYEFCAAHKVPHQNCGKLIVATDATEAAELAGIEAKAKANGVLDLQWMDAAEIHACEPSVAAVAALMSPSTGIISAHDYMNALLGDFEAAGGMLALDAKVLEVGARTAGFTVTTGGSAGRYTFNSERLVNAAGFGAQAVAAVTDGLDPALVPPLYYCKGNYFVLAGRSPFKHLIYPMPDKSGAGLGVHATIDLGGQARFGPDVEWVDSLDYSVSVLREADYYTAVRRYYPGLQDGQLSPGYTGIRPKLQGPGEPAADFLIQDQRQHGVAGLVSLYGIESPGLTSSLAIAEDVRHRLA